MKQENQLRTLVSAIRLEFIYVLKRVENEQFYEINSYGSVILVDSSVGRALPRKIRGHGSSPGPV